MRCVRDTASVCTSCTTGLHVVSSLRRSARRIRPTQSRSMTMWIDACENGSQTRAIFTRHPKRELHEVHYARCVRCVSYQLPQTTGDAQRDLHDHCRASASPRESRLNGSGCRALDFAKAGAIIVNMIESYLAA